MKRTYLILLIAFMLANAAFAVVIVYWPGMWREDQPWGNYQLGYWPKDSFVVSWTVTNLDPSLGYPYASGCVTGINDTAKVQVFFDNRSGTDYSLNGITPQDWFYPVLFDPYLDVFSSEPLADTSGFEYRFEHWVTMLDHVTTSKPDTIFSLPQRGWDKGYGMVYSIWGLTPGTYRVILKPNTTMPTYVKPVVDNASNYFIITKGQSILDTMNSYVNIAEGALMRREYTLFNSYTNNIFSLEPESLPGWALRYHGYAAQADTLNAIAAIDTLLNIIANRLDPLIPDTSTQTPVHCTWLKQWNDDYSYYRSRMLSPKSWVLPRR